MIVGALVLGPILIGLALYALPKKGATAGRWVGVGVAALTMVMIATGAHAADASVPWLSRPFTANFHFGFGAISFWIVLLLAAVTFSALLASRAPRANEFAAQMLVLQGTMNGVFLAKDMLVFALFWDFMLIPVFLLLLGWGMPSRERAHDTAAWHYLIYNVAGGLALLLATAAFGVLHGTTDVIGATATAESVIGNVWGPWILAGFAFAFLVKTPVWPLHTWMPDTYAEASPPVVASVSAVQSKAGLYGFIVIGVPFLSEQMHAVAPLMVVLGLISLVYGALVALSQNDAKRIVAYSSLSHLGLILIAIFSFNAIALAGAVVYIIAHGLFSAGAFLTLGFVEEREETRDIRRLGGIGTTNPRLAGAMMLSALAALGLPGLAGFAGELLILTGIYAAGLWWAALIALAPIVLAAGYMLRLFQTVMNGPTIADLPERADLTWIEGLALAPLIAGFVLIGINPHPLVHLLPTGANVVAHLR